MAEVGPGRVYVSGGGKPAVGRITQCQLEVGEQFPGVMACKNIIDDLTIDGIRPQVIL